MLNNEINNFIINKAILNPIYDGTEEYSFLIKQIAKNLAIGKKVITVVDGQLIELFLLNGKISTKKI